MILRCELFTHFGSCLENFTSPRLLVEKPKRREVSKTRSTVSKQLILQNTTCIYFAGSALRWWTDKGVHGTTRHPRRCHTPGRTWRCSTSHGEGTGDDSGATYRNTKENRKSRNDAALS